MPRCATLRNFIWKVAILLKISSLHHFFYFSFHELNFMRFKTVQEGVYVGHLHPSAFLIILYYSHGILWPFQDLRAPCAPCSQCHLYQTGSENFSQNALFNLKTCSFGATKTKCFDKFQENTSQERVIIDSRSTTCCSEPESINSLKYLPNKVRSASAGHFELWWRSPCRVRTTRTTSCDGA